MTATKKHIENARQGLHLYKKAQKTKEKTSIKKARITKNSNQNSFPYFTELTFFLWRLIGTKAISHKPSKTGKINSMHLATPSTE
ncbi:hypothetical protein [Pseudomonas sp. Irchel 3A18]|uniref:hypothetical protein n=1 Tax=Pseudomonas sp. Irchel 3A18 TaxID=2008905 RepID=UPI00117B4082|nr:hypothetical protein [Pseudomonas sp. Irchel 3A18]